ncbi:YfgJ family double zinc ribbon protein [Cetobacterium sp.]|uniref:YfgJ family double zinc ribbon protein n=1 Tax=Cetobacterium sp. TaxID=2071632 RepID=UPI003F2CD771
MEKEIKKAYCSECGSELEKLAACGSLSFWCNKCNELKSRKTVIYKVEKPEEESVLESEK